MATNSRDLVAEFHKAFGLLISENPNESIFVESPQVVRLRYSLILEEYNELIKAVADDNIEEVIDALMDILYVLYGATLSYGVSATILSNANNTGSQSYSAVCKKELEKPIEEFGQILDQFHLVDTISGVEGLLNELIRLTYNMCLIQGIDVDYCFGLVHKSNMSKLCANEILAQRTVAWYKTTQTVYDSPTYRFNAELGLWVVYNESTGKVLKSIDYHPVSFKEYLANCH